MKFAHVRASGHFTFAEQIFHREAISFARKGKFRCVPALRQVRVTVHAIEQYQMEQYLPAEKGRRIVKILRPFFLTSTAFVGTKAYSEMFCFRKT